MKKRVGSYKGKPIVELGWGGENILTKNEIVFNSSTSISNCVSDKLLPSDITKVEQITYTMNSSGDSFPSEKYDITDLIHYSEELGAFYINKSDYDEIKGRDSYSSEFYFCIYYGDYAWYYSLSNESPQCRRIILYDKSYKSYKAFQPDFGTCRLEEIKMCKTFVLIII